MNPLSSDYYFFLSRDYNLLATFCKGAIDTADYKAVIITFLIVNLYSLFGRRDVSFLVSISVSVFEA